MIAFKYDDSKGNISLYFDHNHESRRVEILSPREIDNNTDIEQLLIIKSRIEIAITVLLDQAAVAVEYT